MRGCGGGGVAQGVTLRGTRGVSNCLGRGGDRGRVAHEGLVRGAGGGTAGGHRGGFIVCVTRGVTRVFIVLKSTNWLEPQGCRFPWVSQEARSFQTPRRY